MLGIYLPLNLVRLALYEVHQIGELILGEPEVCQPERILIIIELPANHSAPELNVVRTRGPGQRTLFLENVIDIQDGNKPVVSEREAAAYGPHGHDVNRGQP